MNQSRDRISSEPDESGREAPLVIVVDDDAGVRASLEDLFLTDGLDTDCYPTTASFLEAGLPNRQSCLVLDVRLPQESGLDLQSRLVELGAQVPIVFITGHADVPMTVRAMKLGAVNFLTKPFRDQELLEAVWEALRQDESRRAVAGELSELYRLAEQLTPREVEILTWVDRGLLNKQIAHELSLAEITVKMHRSSAFRKLKARTVTDMIQKIRRLDLDSLAHRGSRS